MHLEYINAFQVYIIVKLYLIKCNRNLNTQGGRASKFFELSKGTNGLWSVSIWMVLPKRYIKKFSAVQVNESASFYIWAYRLSVSDIVREAYATGCHLLSTSWGKTTPSPYEEASAESLRFVAGL